MHGKPAFSILSYRDRFTFPPLFGQSAQPLGRAMVAEKQFNQGAATVRKYTEILLITNLVISNAFMVGCQTKQETTIMMDYQQAGNPYYSRIGYVGF